VFHCATFGFRNMILSWNVLESFERGGRRTDASVRSLFEAVLFVAALAELIGVRLRAVSSDGSKPRERSSLALGSEAFTAMQGSRGSAR
jgi:hypothetical protein